MSVRILQNKCVCCGRCLSVCPGNLLKKGEDGNVHISNIRKKLKSLTEKEYIQTVWGIGYRLQTSG